MGLRDELSASARAKKIFLDYFVYTATWNPLGALATINVAVPVTADSDFVLDAMALCSYTAAGVFLPNPDYLLQMVDQGSGRNLQDNPVHVNNITGQGNLLYIMPEPKLFKGSGAILCVLQNLTAVGARVDLALVGRKVFYQASFSRENVFGGFF